MREGNVFSKTMRESTSIAIRRICQFVLIVLFANSFFVTSVRATENNDEVVRVGFFAFDGYHTIDEEDQTKSGYGYEVLQMMARYNDWVYDYVGYDSSWNDMLTMLENGDIDLVTSATYSADRAEKFAYSDSDIGTKASILTVKAGNNDIIAGEYSTYEGMKVGLLKNNTANEALKELAVKEGFKYEEIIKDSTQEINEALQNGEVDAIVTSNLRIINNEWIIEEFNPTPFYVIVRKDNTELLAEVNSAIENLDFNINGWRTKLWSDYYTPTSADEIAYTIEEQRYLASIGDEMILKATVSPDRSPYSYFEDGVAKGILVDMFEKMMSVTNIKYEIIETKTREEYNDLIDSGTIDIRIDAIFDYNEAETRNYKLTDTYFSSNISRIEKKNNSGNNLVASLILPDTTAHNKLLLEQYNLKMYETLEDCVRAVEKGDVFCTYVYTYCAQEFEKKDVAN